MLSDKSEGLLWDIEDVMDQKENPEILKLNMETDELYASVPVIASRVWY
jgi:hypothetical protein